MDTEKCAALLCALEEGTLARAADRLGYTPSGISRMIAALEEDVGFPLLYRGRSGVSATGECETLLPALRQMVYQAESCRMSAGRRDLRQKHIAAVRQGGAGEHEPAEPAGGAVRTGLHGAVRHLLEEAAHRHLN